MMDRNSSFFFCGIGGSGMFPLACIVRARGGKVAGSDRALDQGARPTSRFPARARDRSVPAGWQRYLRSGSASGDFGGGRESIPTCRPHCGSGAERITRPQLLARLFNAAPIGVAVGGTSGKSTTTGMIAWILDAAGLEPTVMNGAVMKNFVTPDTTFASALVGGSEIFVSEVDESDGSIALYDQRSRC
jgi:UDP-N-acetylmuramate--alanine ligase